MCPSGALRARGAASALHSGQALPSMKRSPISVRHHSRTSSASRTAPTRCWCSSGGLGVPGGSGSQGRAEKARPASGVLEHLASWLGSQQHACLQATCWLCSRPAVGCAFRLQQAADAARSQAGVGGTADCGGPWRPHDCCQLDGGGGRRVQAAAGDPARGRAAAGPFHGQFRGNKPPSHPSWCGHGSTAQQASRVRNAHCL